MHFNNTTVIYDVFHAMYKYNLFSNILYKTITMDTDLRI